MVDKNETIGKARALLRDMVMELHFRGCEDGHPLIRRAGELEPLLREIEGRAAEGAAAGAAPAKLFFMDPEAVAVLDLEREISRGRIPAADLAEAAFTFENQLMALVEDQNTIPLDAYADMPPDALIRIIRAAVDGICRIKS